MSTEEHKSNNDLDHEKSLEHWTEYDVSKWLKSIGMENYIQIFERFNITGQDLNEMSEQELESRFSITSVNHRNEILEKLAYFKSHHEYHSIPQENENKTKEQNHDIIQAESDTNNVNVEKIKPLTSSSFPLYVDGIEYEYKKICTFCLEGSSIAALYCKSCNDFLCNVCDQNIHKHVKKQHHKRTLISTMDANDACLVITSFMKCSMSKQKLRQRAKETFERLYDTKLRKHYYRNRATMIVQYTKPVSLGSEDVKPFLTQDEASFKILSVYRYWKSRQFILQLFQEQYAKYYSVARGNFYYLYLGNNSKSTQVIDDVSPTNQRIWSLLIPKTPMYSKPRIFCSFDLKPQFNQELAILRIQLFARMLSTMKYVRKLVRKHWKRIFDPISGRYFYWNPTTGTKQWQKPQLLGREKWDPQDARFWTVEDVCLFIRRFVLRKIGILDIIVKYQVDGIFLLSFDEEDFKLVGIPCDTTPKLISDLKGMNRRECYHESVLKRRAKLRTDLRELRAICLIQRNVRRSITRVYDAKCFYDTVKKIQSKERKKLWWSDYKKVEFLILPRAKRSDNYKTIRL